MIVFFEKFTLKLLFKVVVKMKLLFKLNSKIIK